MEGTEATATRCGTCRKCGVAVSSRGRRGRTPSICVACKKDAEKERPPFRRTNSCKKCASEFEASSKQTKFCQSCRPKAEMMTCVICQTVRKKSAGGGNSVGLCCSKKCAGILRSRNAKERARARGDGLRSLLSYCKKLINEERLEASREYLSKCVAVAEWMYEWDKPLRARRAHRRTRAKGCRKHTARASKRGLPRSYSRSMSLPAIGDRDAWTCRLCMRPIVDPHDRKSPLSPCIDHIVPINHPENSRHGHTPDNVQVAHRRCNEAKGCSVACESLLTCDSPREWLAIAGIDQTPGVGKNVKNDFCQGTPRALETNFRAPFTN
jgi:hypothetical protein